MKINKEFEKTFKDYREIHTEQCMLMSQFIYTYIEMHKLLNIYLDQINLAPSYFQLTFRSIRTSLILWVSKAFTKREGYSLFNYLEFIRQNVRYFTKEYNMYRTDSPENAPWYRKFQTPDETKIQQQLTELESVLPIVDRIVSLRDKYHAHLDRTMANNKEAFLKANHFTFDEIKRFPILYSDIINYYSIAFDGENRLTMPINWNDLENILKPLKPTQSIDMM